MRERLFEIIETAGPDDAASKCYDRIMVVLICLSIVPLCFKTTNTIFYIIEKVTAVIFIIDYILRWSTADLKLTEKKLISFIEYPFTFFALIDIISILPSITPLSSCFKLLRLLRLGKAFKTLKFLRYSKNFNVLMAVVKSQKRALWAVCCLAFGYILLSALIMFQVEPENFGNFFDAVYWAVVTLTTVGYGDVYPISDIGRIVSMLSSFIGIAIVALPTGIITAGYMQELEKND